MVWDLMRDLAANKATGMRIRCGLFGRVKIDKTNGEFVGVIPSWLQNEAKKHGFMVVGADFSSDTYTFEILPSALLGGEW